MLFTIISFTGNTKPQGNTINISFCKFLCRKQNSVTLHLKYFEWPQKPQERKGHIEIQTTSFPRDSNQGKANFEAQMLLPM